MATKQPSSQSELELFRVLQRANLLQYYDTFIAQGGDDVQQLCEAGEEEFLEIMALVGMASKPLHVRRLQKALQEWAANPAIFQQPLEQVTSTTVAAGSILASLQQGISYSPPHSAAAASVTSWSPQPAAPAVETLATLPQSSQMQTSIGLATSGAGSGGIGGNKEEAVRVPVKQEEEVNVQSGTPSPPSLPHIPDALLKRSPSPASSNISSRADCTSPGPPPNLTEAQIQSIAEIAAKMARTLPPLEPKPMNLKKQHSKEIMEVMMMTNEDGDRLEKLRLYGAIYGRFDSKRKNVLKPMSLHEISVNEAAAQLCLHCPALLTRREELFPLARHIVKESGYRYAKGHSRAHSLEDMAAKRAKLDSSLSNITSALSCSPKNHMERTQRQTRQSEITVEISAITTKLEILKAAVNQAKNTEDVASLQKLQLEMDSLTATQLHLVAEQNQLNQSKRRNKVGRPRKLSPDRKPMEDDNGTDSSDFPSTASSPNHSTDLDMELLKETLSKIPPKHGTTEARQVIQDTLFDEGLRIAQQYGMADFAEELQGLKYVTCDDSNDADSVKTIKDNGTENSKEAGNEDTGLKSNNRDNGDHGNKSNSMIVIEPKVANGDSS